MTLSCLLEASRRLIVAAFAAGVLLASGPPARRRAVTVAPEAAKGARQEELDKVQAEQKKAADVAARLKAELDAIGEDRRKLSQLLIGTAANIRTVEDRIAESERRLNALSGNEDTIRRSLASRRAVIAEVLAALQRLGRRPPPALLVSPEDALQSVRAAILLGAVLPDMKVEVDTLVADLAELVRVRSEIAAEREVLGRDLAALSQERTRMTVLVQERQRKQTETEKALEGERARAVQLARQADNLKDLIAKIEQEIASSARAAAAAQAGTARPADPKSSLAALNDPGRLSPAIAFASAKGALPLPISGIKIRDFGVAGRPRRNREGPVDRKPRRCAGHGAMRRVGGLCGTVPVLWTTLDPECRRRISYPASGDGADFGRSWPVCADRRAGCRDGRRATIGRGHCDRFEPAGSVHRVSEGRVPVDPSPWWAATGSEKVRG